jgi:chemotaxis protein methyltransferase CheR
MMARHHTDRTLRLWSAGCATGEEPYTLAILLRQILSEVDRWKILILATDINRQALSQAATGRYRPWSFRETDPVIQSTYFTPDGDTFTLKSSVRDMVTFGYHNLAEDNYPSPANQTSNLDLILCRNVTIYLPTSLIYEIANRFYQCLSNGGWLIVGPSETHLEIYRQFQMLNFDGAIVYQKVLGLHPFVSLRTATQGQIDRRPAHPQPESPSFKYDTVPTASALSRISSAPILRPPPISGSLPAKATPKANPERSEDPPSKTGPDAAEWGDLCRQGEALMKQHRYDEARQCFLTCMEEESTSITAKYRMAWLEANAGRLNEARKWAQQALDRDPLRSEVHYTLALIHEAQGELEEAINRLKKVIYLDPNFILAHFGLFHLYQRTSNPIQAERHRTLTIHLASKLSPDTVLPGSDDLTAGQLLTMAQAVQNSRIFYKRTTHPTAMLRGKS